MYLYPADRARRAMVWPENATAKSSDLRARVLMRVLLSRCLALAVRWPPVAVFAAARFITEGGHRDRSRVSGSRRTDGHGCNM